jgi:hypothetical protein
MLLLQSTVALTQNFPVRSFALPGPQPSPEDASFLARFEIADAMILASDEGREHVARKLLEGVTFDSQTFAETLSVDLVTRIDENILGGLAYLNERKDDAAIDRNLQYGQFWQERGISLVQAGTQLPQLDQAFDEWQAAGRAKYTLRKINRWHRQAELIARRERPSAALEQWWALDEAIRSLESSIEQAVVDYDNWIDLQVHDRRR